ncbi:MAG: FxsA family protein [Amylibacter sp.]|nr:FxsA family protein [Amylibacter sp.]
MFMLIIFIAIPIIEIALFIQVGGAIGLYPTLAIVLLTAILGTTLLKSQGLSALGTLQNSLQLGQNPVKQIIHGAMILISGVFLLTPGFFTDAFGILLLIPGFRSFLINLGAEKFANRMNINTFESKNNNSANRTDVYEADYTVVDNETKDSN